MKDITGQRFGRLVAVKRTEQKKNNGYIWECKCDCGKAFFVSLNYLTSGSTRSCGCLRIESMTAIGKRHGTVNGKKTEKDILGMRFGRLEVIEKTNQRKGSNIVWKCKCDCCNICYVNGYNLRKGLTQSCGCLRIETGMKNIPFLQESRPLIDGTDVYMISDMALRSDNKTGIRGVSWDKGRQCYRVTINFKGKGYYLGRFNELKRAKEVRMLAEEKTFGAFLDWYYEEFPERKQARQKVKI